MIGQLSRLLAWHPAPSAVKPALPSICFEMRKHLAGSLFKIRNLARGSRVLCFFLLSDASLSSDPGEESYVAKKDIQNKKVVG